MPDDYYVSQYSGEEIDALLGGAGTGTVRYDAAQTLTDAQKTQARNNISAMQGIESTDHPGCYYVLNGSAVEWINPPMQLGVEYRTPERYLGKPVYVKKVDFGNAPAGATKEVSCATNVANVVDYNLTVLNGIFGQENTIISDDGTLVARPYSKLAEGELSISLAVFEDISTRSVDLVVKYTKTTD